MADLSPDRTDRCPDKGEGEAAPRCSLQFAAALNCVCEIATSPPLCFRLSLLPHPPPPPRPRPCPSLSRRFSTHFVSANVRAALAKSAASSCPLVVCRVIDVIILPWLPKTREFGNGFVFQFIAPKEERKYHSSNGTLGLQAC